MTATVTANSSQISFAGGDVGAGGTVWENPNPPTTTVAPVTTTAATTVATTTTTVAGDTTTTGRFQNHTYKKKVNLFVGKHFFVKTFFVKILFSSTFYQNKN